MRTETAEPSIAYLPTPEQIAARLRRQRIGVVLADICRDLGITPRHPLWDELHYLITRYDGNYVRLVMERLDRAFPIAHILAGSAANPLPLRHRPVPVRPPS